MGSQLSKTPSNAHTVKNPLLITFKGGGAQAAQNMAVAANSAQRTYFMLPENRSSSQAPAVVLPPQERQLYQDGVPLVFDFRGANTSELSEYAKDFLGELCAEDGTYTLTK